MTAGQIKAIVFDIGGVLLDWDPRYLYRKLIPDEAEMETFLHTVCNNAWNLEQDRGRDWKEAVNLLTQQHPDKADLIKAYDERWPEMVQSAIHGTVDIMMELRSRGYKLYSITNFSEEKLEYSMKEYPFLRGFDGIIVSGKVKLLKPDPAIYKALLDEYDLNPRQLLFIDDRRENVQAAWDAGYHAVQFLSPAQLEQDLIAANILTFPEEDFADDSEEMDGCCSGCSCQTR